MMSGGMLAVLAVAMSADAFAAALAKGAAAKHWCWRTVLQTALVFGAVEALAPLFGWAAGTAAKPLIEQWDHWLAFVLLSALGGKMFYDAHTERAEAEDEGGSHPLLVLATALATSVDSMVAGVGLAFLDVSILTAAALIGLTTLLMAACGMWLGRQLGHRVGRWAGMAGGVLLVCIGLSILTDHLGIW